MLCLIYDNLSEFLICHVLDTLISTYLNCDSLLSFFINCLVDWAECTLPQQFHEMVILRIFLSTSKLRELLFHLIIPYFGRSFSFGLLSIRTYSLSIIFLLIDTILCRYLFCFKCFSTCNIRRWLWRVIHSSDV